MRQLVLCLLVCSQLLLASPTESSMRMQKRFGVDTSLVGDPFPTLLGINANYNAWDFLRLKAGAGLTSNMDDVAGNTFAVGARFLVPSWDFTPFTGISLAFIQLDGHFREAAFGFPSGDTLYLYVPVGLEWQTKFGLHVASSVSMALSPWVALPTLSLGWYF